MLDEKKLHKILKETDPVGLAPGFTSPEDEYGPEAKYIIENVVTGLSESELAQQLEEIFVKFFDENLAKNNSGYPENYRVMAHEIQKLL